MLQQGEEASEDTLAPSQTEPLALVDDAYTDWFFGGPVRQCEEDVLLTTVPDQEGSHGDVPKPAVSFLHC